MLIQQPICVILLSRVPQVLCQLNKSRDSRNNDPVRAPSRNVEIIYAETNGKSTYSAAENLELFLEAPIGPDASPSRNLNGIVKFMHARSASHSSVV